MKGKIKGKVTVNVFYVLGDICYNSVAYNSNTSGGAGATAKKKKGGADVVAAHGSHSVSFGAYSWNSQTYLGKMPTVSIRI